MTKRQAARDSGRGGSANKAFAGATLAFTTEQVEAFRAEVRRCFPALAWEASAHSERSYVARSGGMTWTINLSASGGASMDLVEERGHYMRAVSPDHARGVFLQSEGSEIDAARDEELIPDLAVIGSFPLRAGSVEALRDAYAARVDAIAHALATHLLALGGAGR